VYEEFRRYVVELRRRPEVPRSEDLVREHVAYLKLLAARGQLELAGPFEDQGGGLLLLKAGSQEEAEALVAQDPFVLAGSSEPVVRAMTLSCPENGHLGFG